MGLYRRYFKSEYLFIKRQQIDKKIVFFVVAKDEDRFVCVMTIIKVDDTYRFLHIVTDPDYEGQGIATQLQFKAIEFCKKEGALIIDVMKEEGGFFDNKKFGFNETTTYTIKGIKWVYYIWNKSKKMR